MKNPQNQGEILQDKNSKGEARDWRGRKILGMRLSEIFSHLGYRQNLVERVATCGDQLEFVKKADGSLRLAKAYFCKNKLCSMCNWRRSMKHSYQTSVVVDEAMKQHPKARFLFLTLTVKNVPGEELSKTFSALTQAFDRLFRRAKVKKNLIGHLRATEVTHNEITGEYHPHLHVLLMVKSSYFKSSKDYITQEEWGQMWSQSLKVDYVPMVDVRAVKEQGKGLKGAILETAKYPTKPIKLELENAQVVEDLYNGLYRKRQIAYGGLFKEIKKKLELDDLENGDLVHTGEEKEELSGGTKIIAVWNASRQNYFIK